jgi:hypothetical protein
VDGSIELKLSGGTCVEKPIANGFATLAGSGILIRFAKGSSFGFGVLLWKPKSNSEAEAVINVSLRMAGTGCAGAGKLNKSKSLGFYGG